MPTPQRERSAIQFGACPDDAVPGLSDPPENSVGTARCGPEQ